MARRHARTIKRPHLLTLRSGVSSGSISVQWIQLYLISRESFMPLHAVSCNNTRVRGSEQEAPWIWDGLIAADAITLLSAPEKTGKTTLLSLMLDRRREGGQLLGRTVKQGRTIVCSEERSILWALRQPPLDFGSEVEFHHPTDRNTLEGWVGFIDHLLNFDEEAFDLLVIDTVMSFLPSAQNQSAGLRKALNELRVLSPLGVLLVHQNYAARTRSRARGPLTAFADILIDMQVPPGDLLTRRRHFHGVGRYPGTLQFVAAELNPEGTDYIVLSEGAPAAGLAPCLETLRQLLKESPYPLTCQEILDCWPETEPRPRADSLRRTLKHGCELGVLVREGEGTKAEAFRYGAANG